MARYTNDSRDRVREAVDFVELVSARTELRRAGASRYEGLCPFHDERTPSFGIDPVQKVYYCFGCQASGDVFTFVQETEGVDFGGALELLADRYGVELQREQEDPEEAQRRKRRERLLELLERTCAYYERYLSESSEAARARGYLASRGLGEAALREFRVGYAPSAWDRVLLASRRARYSNREIHQAGLAQRSGQSGALYDRFRSRIMFPLADIRGRVLGFGARALERERAGERESDQARSRAAGHPPKYLNTSDNDVYHKGRHLYGAHLARAHATRAGQVIVCEGYTDTIALHQAGMRNAVGLMGTALTGEQVGELARMAQTVLLALDADSAGQEAMLRASSLAAKRKLELRVVPLPPGADPADLLQREGAEAMQALIDSSEPFVRFRVESVLAGGDDSTPEGRDAMLEQLRPVFATLAPSAMRMELVQMVSGRLALSEGLAERLLSGGPTAAAAGVGVRGGRAAPRDASHVAGAPAGTGADASADRGPRVTATGSAAGRAADGPQRAGAGVHGAAAQRAAGALERREETERAFLALCIAFPGPGEQALAGMDLGEHFSSELLRRAAEHLRAGGLGDPLDRVPEEDHELKALLAQLVVEAGRERSDPAMLEVQRLQLELSGMDRKIRRARGADKGDVSELAKCREEVKRQFDQAYGRALEETGERQARTL